MYREKALKLLEKLKSFNYKKKSQYDIDIETKKIIEGIVNECKSTTFIQKRMEQKQEDMEVHLQYRLWRI